MRLRAISCLTLLGFLPARAAPLERDLGQGLVYCRIHALPADLPPDDFVRNHPCVVDIRCARGGREAAAAFAGWIRFHATARTPILLLANAGTDRDLLAAAAPAAAVPGLILIGPRISGFTPDVPVAVDAAADRRAYEALETGASIESLTVDKREKPREDEAMLEREHLPDSAVGDSPDKDREAAQPRPLLDKVLLRAVQLHRALLALRRL